MTQRIILANGKIGAYEPFPSYQQGLIEVGNGHSIYFECSGNPEGIPAVFVHGGPGGGTDCSSRQVFNPEKYRIVVFDQRGCGKSQPQAHETLLALEHNTTWDLVADMEKLRSHLGIERWLLFGGSWGSTLSLAYAQTHPHRVIALVLRGIFTLSNWEINWFYEGGASAIFPDVWQDFVAPAKNRPLDASGKPISFIKYYHQLLHDPNPDIHLPAAQAWTKWETITSKILPPTSQVLEDSLSPAHALTFARIENHFFYHNGWMLDEQLLDNAQYLNQIPGVIVQGRYDMVCPIRTAWNLSQRWTNSEFIVTPDAGHSYTELNTLAAIVDATDRFSQTLDNI